MKRALVVGVLLAMLLSVGIVEGSSVAEPIVLSVLYNERVASPFQEDWLILEEYAKRRNVVLDVRLGDDADYNNELIRIFESGKMPDIILKVWPDTIESYATTGVLLAFSDYEHLGIDCPGCEYATSTEGDFNHSLSFNCNEEGIYFDCSSVDGFAPGFGSASAFLIEPGTDA